MKYEHLLSESVNNRFKNIVDAFFNKIHENKMGFVEENEELEETTDCAGVGNFAYDAPAFTDKKTGDHSQIFRKSWNGNIKNNQKYNENFIKNNILKPLVEQYLLEYNDIDEMARDETADINSSKVRNAYTKLMLLQAIKKYSKNPNATIEVKQGKGIKVLPAEEYISSIIDNDRNRKQYSKIVKYVEENYLDNDEIDYQELQADIDDANNNYQYLKANIDTEDNLQLQQQRLEREKNNRNNAYEALSLLTQLYSDELTDEDKIDIQDKIKTLEKQLLPDERGKVGDWYTARGRKRYNDIMKYSARYGTPKFAARTVLPKLMRFLEKLENDLRVTGNVSVLKPKIERLKHNIKLIETNPVEYFKRSALNTKDDTTTDTTSSKDTTLNKISKVIDRWKNVDDNSISDFLTQTEIDSLKNKIYDIVIEDMEDGISEEQSIKDNVDFEIEDAVYQKNPKFRNADKSLIIGTDND
jgi:hypothetical protein